MDSLTAGASLASRRGVLHRSNELYRFAFLGFPKERRERRLTEASYNLAHGNDARAGLADLPMAINTSARRARRADNDAHCSTPGGWSLALYGVANLSSTSQRPSKANRESGGGRDIYVCTFENGSMKSYYIFGDIFDFYVNILYL